MRTTIITQVPVPSVITELEVGPQGPPGEDGEGSGAPEALAARLDTDNRPLLYAGEAEPASLETDPVWRIWRVDTTLGSVKQWANGVATFVHRWTERSDLIYL